MVVSPLTNNDLTIRPLTNTDLDFCYELFNSFQVLSLKDTQHWLGWTIASYIEHTRLYQPIFGERAIVQNQSQTIVGLIGLSALIEPFQQLPSFGQKAHCPYSFEVGLFWAIHPKYRRQGHATNAAQIIIEHAFHDLNYSRIFAGTEYDNKASIGVMKKLGMKIEYNPFSTPEWFQVRAHLNNPKTIL